MPRTRRCCNVQMPPRVKGFLPMGFYASEISDPVILHLDEFESIRLLDKEHMNQADAALLMNVSRPTLTRIYERARQKIAQALTEARQILIEGGNTMFVGEWYCCSKCCSNFNITVHQKTIICPLCSNTDVVKLNNSNQEI
ncbi:MAG: DUF134 domain-containing protein [Bacteroidales bacterium]|nr:DUF134 domain-containing protein [Bacteroidales bacterium]